jgi:hypothetical protein
VLGGTDGLTARRDGNKEGNMSKHEIFSASSAATWLECSWSALNAVPGPPRKASTSAAAQAGTDAHEAMADGDIDEVESFLARLEPGFVYRELRVTVTDDCGGTLDLFNEASRVATIIDAKFGKWDVAAYHNKQMLTYAAALLPKWPAEWWRLVIYQPNGLDEEPWKQWMAHRSEVEAHRARVLRAVADRSAPKPGPHCRWCIAFQVCPAMSSDAGFVMGAMSRRIEDLTTEELTRLLRLIRALGDVKEVYEEALTAHLKLGRTAAGVSLKPGRAWRAWNDPIQAAQVIAQRHGVTALKPPTPAQAEKLSPEMKQYVTVGSHKPPGEMKAVY